MSDVLKIAAVQMQPEYRKPEQNLSDIVNYIRQAVTDGAQLIVFPECALSGYVFDSLDDAMPYAQTVPGEATGVILQQCREFGVHVVVGLLEKDSNRIYNSCILAGPGGLIGCYRKCHLPFLGIDRFTSQGEEAFPVFPTAAGNIGMHICYDVTFPESARVMTLRGADIIVLPSNFPQGRGEKVLNYIVNARALENRVHMVAANRSGSERGTSFAGLSKIVNTAGETLAQASPDGTEIIYGDVDIETARHKRLTLVPGQYEIDYMKDRRPELYGLITKELEEGR